MSVAVAPIAVNPTREFHPGIWLTALKTQRCGKCGRRIPACHKYLFFPWFPGRASAKRIACKRCATGVVA